METKNVKEPSAATRAACNHESSTSDSWRVIRKGKHIQGKQKTEAVERLRNGEDLLALSTEYGVTAGRILYWKEIYGSDEEALAGLPEGEEVIRFLKRELELLRNKNEELRNELRRMGCTPLA